MSTITNLKNNIKGDVVTPDHPEYAQSLRRWACNAERNAAIVVFVKHEADVTTTVNYAKKNQLPIAIRGGGHSPTGASSSEGGVVIDLSRYLSGVRIDPGKKLAYVGGGAIWETVDVAAMEYGLASVGGTVNHTGVGGLTLGGGYGWLSGEHGLVIDNLVQATIVIADGSVVIANKTKNSDLFFGVRGGGCNFGVVTEFVIGLHEQRRTVFAGLVIFPSHTLQQIVEVAKEWYPNIRPKEGMLMVTACQPDLTPIVACVFFYNGSEDEGRERYKKFFDIGPLVDMAKETPYEKVNGIQNALAPHGNGIYWKALAHEGPHYESITKAYEKGIEISKTGIIPQIVYEWWPLQKICAVPSTETAFRRSSYPNCLINLVWPAAINSQEKNEQARPLAHEIAALVAGGSTAIKSDELLGYNNYNSEGVAAHRDYKEDKVRVAFGGNYPRLQEIKRKYDPGNFFNMWFAIAPA